MMQSEKRIVVRKPLVCSLVRRPQPAALIRQSPVAKVVLAKVLDE